MGWRMMLVVLLFSILAAGLMAVVSTMRTKRMVSTLKNMWVLVRGFVTFGLRPNPQISLDNPALIKLPFGVAVAAATMTCYLIVRFHMTF